MCVGVVQIISQYERQVEFLREPQQILDSGSLDGQPVVHDFNEKVLFAQDVPHRFGCDLSAVVIPDPNLGLNLTRNAPARGDESLRVRAEEVEVHSGLVVEPLDIGRRRHREQIVHSLGGLAEQREVRIRSAGRNIVLAAIRPLHGLLVMPPFRGEVGLETDDRLDVPILSLFPHLERAG